MVKRLADALAAEEVQVFVPISLSISGQGSSQLLLIDAGHIGVVAFAKGLEEVFRAAVLEKGPFELKQGILPGVHVYAVDGARAIEQIVQRIASSTRDHDDFAARAKREQLAVAAGIFPAGVVHQIVAVHFVEYPIS